jgi:hypothetical protein
MDSSLAATVEEKQIELSIDYLKYEGNMKVNGILNVVVCVCINQQFNAVFILQFYTVNWRVKTKRVFETSMVP